MHGILNTAWAPIFLESFAAQPTAARVAVGLGVPDPLALGGFRIEREVLSPFNAPDFLQTADRIFCESNREPGRRWGEWVVPYTSGFWTARRPFGWLGSAREIAFSHEEGRLVEMERREEGIHLHLGYEGIYGSAGMGIDVARSGALSAVPDYLMVFEGLGVRGLKRFWGIPEDTPVWEVGRTIYNGLMPKRCARFGVEGGPLGDFLIQGTSSGMAFHVKGGISQPFLVLPGFYHEVLSFGITPVGGFSFLLNDAFFRLWDEAQRVSQWDASASEAEEPDYYHLTAAIYCGVLAPPPVFY
jgi:hypothetical protein